MDTSSPSADCLIVGAGVAGLCAARELAAAGFHALVLERETTIGGRAATERLETDQGTALADTGAQYFTVREQAFMRLTDRWLAASVVRQWSSGFAVPGGSGYFDGHPRYCGASGMAAIPAHLGQNVLLRLRSKVVSISYQKGWQVTLAGGERLEARALLLTAPVPESLALLATGSIDLPPDEVKLLTRMDYDPCLAVVAVLAEPSQIPPPGGLWPGSARVYWMADNQQKRISPLPAVTIHATPEYSRERMDVESGVIISEMLAEAAPWLGSEVVAASLRRWRYSAPVQVYPARSLLLETPGPLALAGDAFAGPRVEGAALSGMAAGKALAGALRR